MGLTNNVSTEISDTTTDDPFVRVRLTAPPEYVSLVGRFFGFGSGNLEGGAVM